MNADEHSDSESLEPFVDRKRGAVAVILQENRFLAIKRAQVVRAPGKICFPGGGFERGETAEQALMREMVEELSIDVRPLEPVWTSKSVRGFELHWLRAEIVGGEPTPNPDEVEWCKWMTMEEMTSSPDLLDSNVEFF